MNKHSAAGRRYRRRLVPTMVAYVVTIFGASYAFRNPDLAGPLAWALAVAPALPVIGVIAFLGLYVKEETDEFQRRVLVESMLWGIGLTLSATTLVGFLEIYLHTPPLQSFWAFPIFCVAMGVSQLFVRRRYR